MTRSLQGIVAGATPTAAPGSAPTAKLNLSDQVILDANGNGTCQLTPPSSHVWLNVVIAILVTPGPNPVTNPKTPSANYYVGLFPQPAYLVDTTTIGNRNSSARASAYPISGSDSIWVVWSGGQPGYIATLSIIGTERTQP